MILGITVIALVVTIIVLLILSGIGIKALMGNGIISESQEAKVKAEIDNEYRIVVTAVDSARAKNKYGNVKKGELQQQLNEYTKDRGENQTSIEEKGKKLIVEFSESKRCYQVDTNGSVEYLDKVENLTGFITANPSRNYGTTQGQDINVILTLDLYNDSIDWDKIRFYYA